MNVRFVVLFSFFWFTLQFSADVFSREITGRDLLRSCKISLDYHEKDKSRFSKEDVYYAAVCISYIKGTLASGVFLEHMWKTSKDKLFYCYSEYTENSVIVSEVIKILESGEIPLDLPITDTLFLAYSKIFKCNDEHA